MILGRTRRDNELRSARQELRPSGRGLRPSGFDDLGLRRALSDWLLPALVAAMTFLAALALAGAISAAVLARHWQEGASATLTVQVPQPNAPAADGPATRSERVLETVRGLDGVGAARVLPDDELADLLQPWLGAGTSRIALALPAVIEVRLTRPPPPNLAARLQAEAPGTLVETQEAWVKRLALLARSLQACAGLALAVVGFVAVAVVAVATRAGLAARRDAIEIVHGLGATRGYIASRFAKRATFLTAVGGGIGAAAAMPVLVGLANLVWPFTGQDAPPDVAEALPLALWLALPVLPLAAAVIGWATAQATVRRWLRRLP